MTDENVKRGAEWLDEHHPGWDERIDLASLEMDMPCQCILGQVVGNYVDACDRLGWLGDGRLVRWLGFFLDWDIDNRTEDVPDVRDEAWQGLQRAWVDEILTRRKEVQAMEIGKEEPARIVEPMKEPVPTREPKRQPNTAPVPERTPEKVPEKVPVKT